MVPRCAAKIAALFLFAAALLVSSPARADLPAWTTIPGAQLPAGWSWPPPPPAGAIPRAFDLGALLAQTKSCPPIQVAPNVFIPVPCAPGTPSPRPTKHAPKYTSIAPLPAYVDLPKFGLDGPMKDQAQVGVCWAFALTTAAESSLRRQGRTDVLSATHVIAARSEKRLYATGAAGTAIAADAAWPYDPVRACLLNDVLGYRDPWCESAYHVHSGSWRSQPQIVGELRNADAWGLFRVREEKLSGHIEEIATLIALGRAVIANIDIDSQAWGHRGASTGTIPDYAHADRGGHAVVLVAYAWQAGERYFLVHNSWGQEWGRGGYVWIASRTLERHLESAAIVDVYPRGANVPAAGAVSGR